MASRSPQTQQKRARELALKERRERKAEKKRARADERRARTEASQPTTQTATSDDDSEIS
jgi:hypothetical protein